MASPLRWFRKHSMILMVVFGIAAMVIFGLGSVVSMINPSSMAGSGPKNEVVATWKGGELRRDQLRMMRNRHYQSQRFLQAVYMKAAEKKGENFPPSARMIDPIPASFNEEQIDDQLLTRYLLAERAKEEGFVIDDRMVYDYIAQIAGDYPFSKNDLRALNDKANSDYAELEHVVAFLKLELLNQQMSVLANGGMPLVPNTTESVQFYDRTHRRVECKVMPLPVEQYVSKVTDEPSRSQLNEIFEEGRFEYPDPTGQSPGFKVGKKVRIKYFVADFNTFLENEMNKLTDEEIQKEYERLVEAKDNLVMEVVPEEKPDDKDATETGDGAPALEGSEEDPAPKLESDSPESTEGDGESGAKADKSAGDGNGDQSSVVVKRKSVYAAIQDEEPSQPEPGQEEPQQEDESKKEKDSDPAADEGVELQTPTQDDKAADDKAPDDKAPDDKAPDDKESAESKNKEPDQATDEKPDAAKQADDKPAGPSLAEKQEIKRRPKPLKDVADDIKRRLKAADATAALEEALDNAENEIRKHQMKYGRWQSRQYEGEESEAPEEMDYKVAADKYGLQFNETELVDRRQIGDEAIGKIVAFEMQGRRPQAINVGERIFDRYYDTTIYEPDRAEDFASRVTYLYWLAEKVDQKVLEYDEAIPAIKEFWRRKTALEMASSAAQKIADQVNAGEDLALLYPEKTNDTGEFSWFTNLGQIRYSTPIGVTEPGDEFMETVFSLQVGKAGVAANDPQNTVYVIQLIKSSEKTTKDLGEEYLAKQFFTFKRLPNEVTTLSNIYLRKINYQWQDEFLEEMELKWVAR